MKTKLIISGLAFLAITALSSGQNNGVNTRPKMAGDRASLCRCQ